MRAGTFLDKLHVRDPNQTIVVKVPFHRAVSGGDLTIKNITTRKDGTIVIHA